MNYKIFARISTVYLRLFFLEDFCRLSLLFFFVFSLQRVIIVHLRLLSSNESSLFGFLVYVWNNFFNYIGNLWRLHKIISKQLSFSSSSFFFLNFFMVLVILTVVGSSAISTIFIEMSKISHLLSQNPLSWEFHP